MPTKIRRGLTSPRFAELQAAVAAEAARLTAFLDATSKAGRDHFAYRAFQDALSRAVACAGLIAPGRRDDGTERRCHEPGSIGERERDELTVAIGAMLFDVLPRVGLKAVVNEAENIGYAIRYALIEPRPDALEHVPDVLGFMALAAKGRQAHRESAGWLQTAGPVVEPSPDL